MNDIIYENFINQLQNEIDFIGVISEYVSFKKKGKKLWCCCPFHHEKTPSFLITPEKGLFYCFGCQFGGNIFNFIMKIENINFKEAVNFLAEKANIEIPSFEKTDNVRSKTNEINRLYEINKIAKDFFYDCLLKNDLGKSAKEYLFGRGITLEIIKKFEIGFAPYSWDKLIIKLQKSGIDNDMLLKTGLVVMKSSGDGIYDRFRNRIIFSICDQRGRIIGFGGRVLDNSQPKYLNSPETSIFNKRYVLFALDHSINAIKKSEKVIVVEGYLDAITAHKYGFNNVVASLGTAFTIEQAKLLMRMNAEIIFVFDCDAAGEKANLRALETAYKLGIAVKIGLLPKYKDPDEFIIKNGRDAFEVVINSSLSLLEYKIKLILNNNDYSTVEGKIKTIEKIVPIIGSTDNAVARDAIVAELSKTIGIGENSINCEIQKYIYNIKNKNFKSIKTSKSIDYLVTPIKDHSNITASAEQYIIRLMCEEPSLIPYVAAELTSEDIFDEYHREIINSIFDAYNMKKNISPKFLITNLGDVAKNIFTRIINMDEKLCDISRLVDDNIKAIKLVRYKELYNEHCLRAHKLLCLNDQNYLSELTESMRILQQIQRLQK